MIRFVLNCLVMLGLLWFAGFLWFVFAMPVVPESTEKADAVVVLTGGAKRISTALSLLEEGVAPHLFVSGVNPQVTQDDLLRNYRHLSDDVTMDLKATNTYENAIETAAWASENNVSRILLVTSDYHMRRAILTFSYITPSLDVSPYPISTSEQLLQFNAQSWALFKLYAVSYTKYIVAWSAYTTMGLPNAGLPNARIDLPKAL